MITDCEFINKSFELLDNKSIVSAFKYFLPVIFYTPAVKLDLKSYGDISKSYGLISMSYGDISKSYGPISMSYRDISKSYGLISMSYGDLSKSYGNVSMLCGDDSKPKKDDLEPGNLFCFFDQIDENIKSKGTSFRVVPFSFTLLFFSTVGGQGDGETGALARFAGNVDGAVIFFDKFFA